MSSDTLQEAHTTVERVAEQARDEERERTTGSATRAAVQRTMALRR